MLSLSIFKNKYLIATLIFLLWLGLFDQNSLIDRKRTSDELKKLQNDKAYYLQKIEEDKNKLEELKTNKETLEKFAREQYFMKKPNEDIFVIVEEE